MKFRIAFVLLLASFAAKISAQEKYTVKEAADGGTGKVYMGREIAYVMSSAGNGSWLERSGREREENTEKIIAAMPIKTDMAIADVGAGTGYYTFKLIKKVPKGRVYAVELQDDFVRILNQKKTSSKEARLTVVKGSEKSPNLPDASVDLVLMVDVYHELLYPYEMIQAIKKALKPGGRLVLVEYKAEDPNVAIRELHKMSVAQAVKEMAASGFKLISKNSDFPMQHVLVFGLE
ncbi:MAG: class I SAM-dependent methyltransferase [Mucilaginibacter polytrichastri]|nr:class I SAM-dependent methyltransferase [Mucilaginibacter polytrichastri]